MAGFLAPSSGFWLGPVLALVLVRLGLGTGAVFAAGAALAGVVLVSTGRSGGFF